MNSELTEVDQNYKSNSLFLNENSKNDQSNDKINNELFHPGSHE